MCCRAGQFDRPWINHHDLTAIAHGLAYGKRQHRPFRQRVGTKEKNQITLPDILHAAGVLTETGGKRPGGTIAPLVCLKNQLGRTGDDRPIT